MSISAPEDFDYTPGDYVFINCEEISDILNGIRLIYFVKLEEEILFYMYFQMINGQKSCMIKHLKV